MDVWPHVIVKDLKFNSKEVIRKKKLKLLWNDLFVPWKNKRNVKGYENKHIRGLEQNMGGKSHKVRGFYLVIG